MTTTVFLAVIAAAVLHALWNALVKRGSDKSLSMTALVMGNVPIAIAVLFFVPAPQPDSWPYLITGIALQVGYQLLLLGSYQAGDLTHVYPIARGIAPLLVAGVSVVFLGVPLSLLESVAVITIGVGVLSLSLVRGEDGTRNTKAASLACLTGCFIAAYSVVDGIGARLAGTALGYYAWVAIGNAVVFCAIMESRRSGLVSAIPRYAKRDFIIGGAASFVAYATVVWAFTQAPIALVAALRETSIVFVLLIGVFFLKEKLDLAGFFSIMVTLIGAVLLRLSSTLR